jgi:threonine dehydratase
MACDTPAGMDRIVGIDRIRAARDRLADRVHRTPMLTSTTAASMLRAASGIALGDGRLYVKGEHLQKTGSFKARATVSRLAILTAAERERGAITTSAGNAGQAYAFAGREVGVPVTVVMPSHAVRSKVDACRAYGAEVILHGTHVGEAFAEMHRLRDARNLTVVHPFDDPDVIAGNGSVGLEIVEDLPDVDVVAVAVGGGGLISGIAAAVKETRPGVRVYGVEPEGSNALSAALERDEIVRIDPVSVADGLGAPFAGEWTLAMGRRYLDGMVLIDDATILGGLRFAAERMKQVMEPAGAAALAALLYGRLPVRDGECVCVVASGGNVETSRLGELLAEAAPLPGTVAIG